jgi:hypothetical protein
MSNNLCVEESMVMGKNGKRQLYKHFMEENDDRYKKLWLYRTI